MLGRTVITSFVKQIILSYKSLICDGLPMAGERSFFHDGWYTAVMCRPALKHCQSFCSIRNLITSFRNMSFEQCEMTISFTFFRCLCPLYNLQQIRGEFWELGYCPLNKCCVRFIQVWLWLFLLAK